MNFETKEIMQLVTLIILLGGVFWKFSSMLGEIQSELKLITQKLDQVHPQLLDHEVRIRTLEKNCAPCFSRDDRG